MPRTDRPQRKTDSQALDSFRSSSLVGYHDILAGIAKANAEGAVFPAWKDFCSALAVVDPTYIRECGRCGLVFVANRKDKSGCSTSCCAALRMRNCRARAA